MVLIEKTQKMRTELNRHKKTRKQPKETNTKPTGMNYN